MTKKIASAFAYQAFVMQLLGRWTEARMCACQALSLDPADVVALKVQARIQLHCHQYEAAEKTCRQILPGQVPRLSRRGHNRKAAAELAKWN